MWIFCKEYFHCSEYTKLIKFFKKFTKSEKDFADLKEKTSEKFNIKDEEIKEFKITINDSENKYINMREELQNEIEKLKDSGNNSFIPNLLPVCLIQIYKNLISKICR